MVSITADFGCLLPENQYRELFQYSYKVFIEQLGWELKTEGNIETGQFDNEYTCHVRPSLKFYKLESRLFAIFAIDSEVR